MSNICCILFGLLICLYHQAASTEMECNPPCENGGTCLPNLTCSCTNDFRGNSCEYLKALCSVFKNSSWPLKGSSWRCNESSTGTTCHISCNPPQTDETGNDTPRYSCTIDGHWIPHPLPPCVQKFCFEDEYRCGDGNCVGKSLFCDKEKNCMDESDETDCFYKKAEFVFFNEGPDVYRKELTIGSEVQSEKRIPLYLDEAIVTALSFDVKHQILFLSDAAMPAIYSYSVNSRLSSKWKRGLVTDGMDFPVDIAFDWTSNNLYWIDSGYGTAEVVSVDTFSRSIIISDLSRPISLALLPDSGIMFIAADTGSSYGIFRYEMDGRNGRILYTVDESPASLALHPSQTLLYWTDTQEGTIFYGDYNSSDPYSVLRKGLGGIMSLSVREDDIFFTTEEDILFKTDEDDFFFDAEEEEVNEKVHKLRVGGYKKDGKWKSIASSFTFPPTYYPGNYECLINKGGCDYLCLTNELGRSCACSSEKILDADGTSCIDKN